MEPHDDITQQEKRQWVTPDIEVISVYGGTTVNIHESQTAPPFHEHGILS